MMSTTSTTLKPTANRTMMSTTSTTLKPTANRTMMSTTSTTLKPTANRTMMSTTSTTLKPTANRTMMSTTSTTLKPTANRTMMSTTSTTLKPTANRTMMSTTSTTLKPTTYRTLESTVSGRPSCVNKSSCQDPPRAVENSGYKAATFVLLVLVMVVVVAGVYLLRKHRRTLARITSSLKKAHKDVEAAASRTCDVNPVARNDISPEMVSIDFTFCSGVSRTPSPYSLKSSSFVVSPVAALGLSSRSPPPLPLHTHPQVPPTNNRVSAPPHVLTYKIEKESPYDTLPARAVPALVFTSAQTSGSPLPLTTSPKTWQEPPRQSLTLRDSGWGDSEDNSEVKHCGHEPPESPDTSPGLRRLSITKVLAAAVQEMKEKSLFTRMRDLVGADSPGTSRCPSRKWRHRLKLSASRNASLDNEELSSRMTVFDKEKLDSRKNLLDKEVPGSENIPGIRMSLDQEQLSVRWDSQTREGCLLQQGSPRPKEGLPGQGSPRPKEGLLGQGSPRPKEGLPGQGSPRPKEDLPGQGSLRPKEGLPGQGSPRPMEGLPGQGSPRPKEDLPDK
nr:mucin-5AC-like [Procambarus clarkii]